VGPGARRGARTHPLVLAGLQPEPRETRPFSPRATPPPLLRHHRILFRALTVAVHLLFAQPNGRPIDGKTHYDDRTCLLRKAGVRHVRLHHGRHTAATLLLSENVHPHVVMELLGHRWMRTTMDIYATSSRRWPPRRPIGWALSCS